MLVLGYIVWPRSVDVTVSYAGTCMRDLSETCVALQRDDSEAPRLADV